MRVLNADGNGITVGLFNRDTSTISWNRFYIVSEREVGYGREALSSETLRKVHNVPQMGTSS